MAVAVRLSPWPRLTSEVDSAVECLRQVLPDNLDDARIKRIGATASAHVERYAGRGTPQNCKDQATELFSGYLSQARTGPVTKIALGTFSTERMTNHAAMFRNSGAAALLAPWKIRRGGAIPGTFTKGAPAMSRTQLASVDISETAVDITNGLDDDVTYEFQRSITSQASAIILYAFGATTAPSDEADYFTLSGDEFVPFVTPGSVWVKVADTTSNYTAAVAISTT